MKNRNLFRSYDSKGGFRESELKRIKKLYDEERLRRIETDSEELRTSGNLDTETYQEIESAKNSLKDYYKTEKKPDPADEPGARYTYDWVTSFKEGKRSHRLVRRPK